jgi:hypothetical protein
MILTTLAPGSSRLDEVAHRQLYEVVGEGIQILEQARLVRCTVWGGKGGMVYHATRAGQAALTGNSVEQAIAAVNP